MAKFDSFLSELESASVLELNELVKAIEEKFGVSAAAVASAPAAGGAAGGAEERPAARAKRRDRRHHRGHRQHCLPDQHPGSERRRGSRPCR